jgi:hypothetical protein
MAGLGPYWQRFARIEHELTNIYGSDTNYVLEALNHYQRHDGQPVTVRAVACHRPNAEGPGRVRAHLPRRNAPVCLANPRR